jgi:ribosomal protein S12 methylthiotransferase accessory factor
MAAGNSPPECCSQALSEIVERYVKNIIITGGISLPDVPSSILNKFPVLCAILHKLNDHKLSVRVKDASLGGKYPVICALLTDMDSGGVYAAFGSNCRFETAVERTLTELLQGRRLDQLKDFQPPCHDREQVADPFNLESHFVDSDGLLSWSMFKDKADFAFSPWDFSGSTALEFQRLQGLIADDGFDIYRAEYLHSGMYCCRILVPGMSEIYPIDDLVWNNRRTGTILRSHLLKLPSMNLTDLGGFFELIESLGLNDQQLISQTIGVLFEEDSAWATLRIGELKALTLLAMDKREEALDGCSWCLDYGALPKKRSRMYRLLHTLLGFQEAEESIAEYIENLRLFYHEEELNLAESVLNRTSNFPGLDFGSTWAEISFEHENILKIYEHVNRFKTVATG